MWCLNPTWWLEIKPLEKRKDLMSEAMMDSMTADDWEKTDWSVVSGICFCTFLCRVVMFADFQADGRWPCANERVNRTERVHWSNRAGFSDTWADAVWDEVWEQTLHLVLTQGHRVQEQLGATVPGGNRKRWVWDTPFGHWSQIQSFALIG